MEYVGTSITVIKEYYDRFKNQNTIRRINLTDFVNYCLERYDKDEVFRKEVYDKLISNKLVIKSLNKKNPFVKLNTNKKL